MRSNLFFVLSIIALASFCIAQTSISTEQHEAIAVILKLGGTVEVDSLHADKPVVKIDLHETNVSDADLQLLEQFKSLPKLEVLLIGKSKVTEAGSQALQKALPKLRFTEQT